MKNTKQCPKCNSREIGVATGAQTGHDGIYISGRGLVKRRVALDRYICCACGYSEQWVGSATDLEAVAHEVQPL